MPHLAILKLWPTCAYTHMTHIQKVYAHLTRFMLWHVNPHMWTSNIILTFASANFIKKAHFPILTNPHKWVTVEHLMLHGHALSIITRMLHGNPRSWNKNMKQNKGIERAYEANMWARPLNAKCHWNLWCGPKKCCNVVCMLWCLPICNNWSSRFHNMTCHKAHYMLVLFV